MLECGICMEAFSAAEELRQPYVFTSCGHSVCKGCGDNLQARGCTSCSFCNTPVRMPLAKNFALMEQLELLAKLLPSANASAPTCEGKRHKGQSGGPPVATLYCKKCEKRCCEECKAVHDEAHDEAVVPLTERPQQVRYN